TAAGENEFSRHEHHLVVALAYQNLRRGGGTIDQDQRGGVHRAAVRVMVGFLFDLFSVAHLALGAIASLVCRRPTILSDFVHQIHASAAPTARQPPRPSPAAAAATR